DPADVEVIEELATVTGCQIEMVTSTYAAFQRAFLRAYTDAPPAAPTGPAGPGLDAAGSASPGDEAEGLARLRSEPAGRAQEASASREIAARETGAPALAERVAQHAE